MWSFSSPGAVETRLIRTVIPLSADTELALSPNATPAVAISPDGRQVAYVALLGDIWQLYLRSLDQLDARAIEGAHGPLIEMPFFSADGQSLGFVVQGTLMKVAVAGGLPVSLSAQVGFGRGASWLAKDIVVSRLNSLVRVSADSGEPTVLTALNSERHERSHRHAQFLPGGRAGLFTLATTDIDSFDDASIAVPL